MDRNIRIARELVRIAKQLVAAQSGYFRTTVEKGISFQVQGPDAEECLKNAIEVTSADIDGREIKKTRNSASCIVKDKTKADKVEKEIQDYGYRKLNGKPEVDD